MTRIKFAGNQRLNIGGRLREFQAGVPEEVTADELSVLGDSNAEYEIVGDEEPEVSPLHPEIIANLPEGVTVEVPVPTGEGDPDASTTIVGDNPVEPPPPEEPPAEEPAAEATAKDEDDEKGGKGGKRR